MQKNATSLKLQSIEAVIVFLLHPCEELPLTDAFQNSSEWLLKKAASLLEIRLSQILHSVSK